MFSFLITKLQMLYPLYVHVVTYAQNYHNVRGVEVSVTPSLDLVHWEHSAWYTGSAHHIMDVHNTHMKNSQSLASLNPLHKVQLSPENDTLA